MLADFAEISKFSHTNKVSRHIQGLPQGPGGACIFNCQIMHSPLQFLQMEYSFSKREKSEILNFLSHWFPDTMTYITYINLYKLFTRGGGGGIVPVCLRIN